MKYLILVLTLILETCNGQNKLSCIPCIINDIENSKNNKKVIYALICGYNKSCKLNVEYGEIINETFFNLLQNSTKAFLHELSKFDSIQINSVCNLFSDPINDLIDISNVINIVKTKKQELNEKEKKIADKIVLDLHKAELKYSK